MAILIAGASGSGKTTLAERLSREIDAVLLQTDDYYHPLDHLTYEERCDVNFDAPESVDGELLTEHVRTLLQGRPIQRPRYDFTRHTRNLGGETLQPRSHVVVEGLFALSYAELRRLGSHRVFVDTDAEVCLDRRVRRDVAERGRTPDEVVWRFRNHVYPMYLRHVAPYRERCDLVVSGACGEGLGQTLDLLARTPISPL